MNKKKNLDLSIIIPCYNEEDNIRLTLSKISEYLKKNFSSLKYEILPINDGSTDKTKKIIRELSTKNKKIIPDLGFDYNIGRGAAVKCGINSSLGKYIICLDADLSYDVDHIKDIVNTFYDFPEVDVVVVSPYMNGGTVSNVPILRLWLSKIANWILRGSYSVKLHTVTCVVRGYKGNLIRNTPFFENGKELHLEIIGKLLIQGANIIEIPGRLHWKTSVKKPRRKTSIKFINSAKSHLAHSLLVKPTRIFQILALLTFFIAVYESFVILSSVIENYSYDSSYASSLWIALKTSFINSPHTFLIASVALILSLQITIGLIFLYVNMIQHNELQRLILNLGKKNDKN